MAFVKMFGNTLLTKAGERPTEEVLANKTAVGVYFSAHWCPPCRGFTPQLAKMYTDVFAAKGMEIIFVSGDRDAKTFQEYYGEQPWVALPYKKRDVESELSKKFKVKGIPSLVILDASGEVITTDGRKAVSSDPTGAKYPWVPPTAAERAQAVLDTLGPDLVAKAGGKPIGLYFSAHWCPPCRGFTPKLAEIYNNGLKEKLEIIFVSSDKGPSEFEEYFKEMPWLALPFEKRSEKAALSDAFGINGIPSFVIINSDGTTITTDGRSKVMSDPTGQNFPDGWLPQPFNDVNDDPSDLNEERCVISLGGSESMHEAVKAVAAEYHVKAGGVVDAMPLRFFKSPQGDVSDQVRKLTGVEGDKLIFLDIPDNGGYYVCEKDKIDADSVRGFIGDVSAKNVTRKQPNNGR